MTPEQITSTMGHWANLNISNDDITDLMRKLLSKEDAQPRDPYRTTIQYLSGLIAFCLAVLVGVFANFPESEGSLSYVMLGGVLAWMAVTAIVAALSLLVTQGLKCAYFLTWKPETPTPKEYLPYVLMGVPTLFGLVPVAYCLRGGAVMLSKDPSPLLPIGEAIRMLFC